MGSDNAGRDSAQPVPVRRPLPRMVRASLLAAAGALVGQVLAPAAVQAGPTGGAVAAGSGRISAPDAKTTRVQQQSQALAINWQSFDVKPDELVQFDQPSSSATVLNRVLNQTPSQIFGAVRANGQVFILNPGGVVIGQGARVDVGGLFVSSLDISDDDFMAGRHTFRARDGEDPGAIVNRGLIRAARGGSVTLVGGQVSNEGVIVADMGHVNLAAGRTATVDFDGDGLVRFEVDGAVLASAGEGAAAAVSNSGEIRAEGGQVLLSAKAASQVFDRAVNNSGLIRAGGIRRAGGKVTLTGSGGAVRNSGTVDASGSSGGSVRMVSDTAVEQHGTIRADGSSGAGGRVHLASAGTTLAGEDSLTSARSERGAGGVVEVLGRHVGLAARAHVDASGATAGGTVRVGGGFRGTEPGVANAARTWVAPDATVNVDARDAGDGGTAIVWADEITRFHGTVSARGGEAGGNGGLVEVSARDALTYAGTVDTSAARGDAGTLLLDPKHITITATGADPVGSNDAFADNATGTSDISAADLVSAMAGASVILQASSDITIETDVDFTTNAATDGNSLTLQAGRHIILAATPDTATPASSTGAVTVTMNGGDFSATVNDAGADPAQRDAGSAAFFMAAGSAIRTDTGTANGSIGIATGAFDAGAAGLADDVGNITLGALAAGTGGIAVSNGVGDVALAGALSAAGGVTLAAGAALSSSVAGTITTDATLADTAAGIVDIDAGSGVSLAGAVAALGNGAGAGGTVTVDTAGGGIALAALDASGGGGASTGGNVTLNAATVIRLGGDVTSAGATSGGDLGFGAAVELDAAAVAISTGATGGNVSFAATLDSAAGQTHALGITAGSGNVTFAGDVGAAQRLGAVTLVSAADVNVDGAFDATAFTQSAGTGTTRIGGATGGGGAMDLDGTLSITTDTITIQDTVTAGGDIAFDAASNFQVTVAGLAAATDRDVTSSGGDIAVSAPAGLLEDSAGGANTRLVAVGGGSQSVTVDAAVVTDGGNLAAPQIVADRLALNFSGDLNLGDDSPVIAQRRDDAAIVGDLAAASEVAYRVTDGNVILDMDFTGGGSAGITGFNGSLVIETFGVGGAVDDAGGVGADAVAFRTSVAGQQLELSTSGAIGAANDGLNIDVDTVSIAGTGGNTVRLDNAAGLGDATYAIGQLAAVDAVTISQGAAGLLVDALGITASNAVSLTATAGRIAGAGKVTGGALTLSAAGGIALATAATTLEVLNTTAGDVAITEDGPVQLLNAFANTAAGAALGLVTLDGSIDTNGVAVSSAGGDIDLEARDAAGGASRADVNINGGSVAAGSGAIVVRAADDVAIGGAVTSAGTVTVVADDAAGDAVGDVDGAISGGGLITGTTVTLSAAEGIAAATAADALDVINGAAGGDVAITEADDVLLVNNFRNAFDGGALSLVATDGSIDTNGVAVSSVNGLLTLDARDAAGGAARADLTIDGGSVASGSGAIHLLAADDVSVNGAVTASGNVTVAADRAGSEAVADGDGAIMTDGSVIAGATVTLSAAEGITARTAATGLDVSNGATAGGVDITESDDVTLVNSFANLFDGGALSLVTLDGSIDTGSVAVTASNATVTLDARDAAGGTARADLVIGAGGLVASGNAPIVLSAADDVTVDGAVTATGASVDVVANNAAGEGADDGDGAIGGAGLITGTTVTLDATGGIAASTAADFLDVANGGAMPSGNVVIAEADAVQLLNRFSNAAPGGNLGLTTANGSIGSNNVGVTANDGTITLDARGASADLTVDGGSVDAMAGAIELLADRDVVVNGAVDSSAAVTVTADSGAIGTDGSRITAGALTATASSGVTLTTDAVSISAQTATNGISIAELNDVTLTSLMPTAGGDVTVVAGGDVLVGLVSNAGRGVSITSTGGSIDDAAADPDTTTDILADTIVLAADAIGQNAHVDLDAATSVSLTTDTAGGDISVVDAGALDLALYTVVTQVGNQSVRIQADSIVTGKDVLGNTVDDLALVATGAGGISDGGVTLTARNLLLDASATAGAAIGAAMEANRIDTAITGSLTATSGAGGGGVFVNDGTGALDIAGIAAGTGDIELQAAGSITQSGAISGNVLSMESPGAITLDDPANDVAVLQADVVGDIRYTDQDGFSVGAEEVSSDTGDVTLSTGGAGTITLAGDIEGARVSLNPGGGVTDSGGGIITADRLDVNAGGAVDLDDDLGGTGHTVAALDGSSAGALTLAVAAGLSLIDFDTGGNAATLIARGGDIAAHASLGSGTLTASSATLAASGGIGIGGTLQVSVPGALVFSTGGAAAAGRILVTDVTGVERATSSITLATAGDVPGAGAPGIPVVPGIRITNADGFHYDAGGDLAAGLSNDTLVLAGNTRLDQSPNVAAGSFMVFDGTTTVGAGVTAGGGGQLFFDGAVNAPVADFTVNTDQVAFSGNVTMGAGNTLTLNSTRTFFVGDSDLVADGLRFGGGPGSIRGTGDLTILRASASAADTVIGAAADPLLRPANVAALNGFAGTLGIGGTRTTPPTAAQVLGDITVAAPLNTLGDVFLVGAGDVMFVSGAGSITTPGTVSVVALGTAASATSGNIRDSDSGLSTSPGTPEVITAGTVELLAANQIGSESGAQGGTLNVSAGTISAAQAVEGDAQVDRIGGDLESASVLEIQEVYALAAAGPLAGIFNDAFTTIGGTSGISQISITTPKQAEDTIGFIDEGVFLLPPTFTSPERALLMPLLGDPDFPSDQRPIDPDDDAAWAVFFEDVVREFIVSRYPLAEDASDVERAAVEAQITRELQAVIAFYEAVRERERRMLAQEAAAQDAAPDPSQGDREGNAPDDAPQEGAPGTTPGSARDDAGGEPLPAAALPSSDPAPGALHLGHTGQPWHQGGIGVEWRGRRDRASAWPETFPPQA